MLALHRRRFATPRKALLFALIAGFVADPGVASLVDLGRSKRVPELGLDWFDLTMTLGRSYDDDDDDQGLIGEARDPGENLILLVEAAGIEPATS